MANLFELDQRIMDCIDTETGEIINEEQLALLEMERDEKIENIAKWILQLDYDIAAYKAQKKHFDALRAQAERKQESLRKYLQMVLADTKWSASDKSVAVNFRKTKSLSIFDEDAIPDRYFNTKIDKTVDKVLITESIKNGETVEGCALVEKYSMSVK